MVLKVDGFSVSIYAYFSVSVEDYSMCKRKLQKPEASAGSHGSRVAGCCKMYGAGAGKQTLLF